MAVDRRATGSLSGAVVASVYIHLERVDLPLALAELHRVLAPAAPVEIAIFEGTQDLTTKTADDVSGQHFALRSEAQIADLLIGAGFSIETSSTRAADPWPILSFSARRLRSLPDTVGPRMRLLVCGLNPSHHSADLGVGFGRAGNRFWPAALAAGIVSRDRDARHALSCHGIGLTDLVKRATPRAAELSRDEYENGLSRLERLCAWLAPDAVCMVGLAGWRAAVNRRAVAGWQEQSLAGAPVYVMPSTSGLNARSQLPDLTEHLREAYAGLDTSTGQALRE